MKYLMIALLFFACSSSKPIVVPPTPAKQDTVFLPGKPVPGPTVYILITDTLSVVVHLDSVGGLLPDPSGDNWAQLQAILNAGIPLRLGRYNYSYSKPLVVAKIVNGSYAQSWCSIVGVANAKNASFAYTSNLMPTFTNAPAIILQQCKGCEIRNVNIVGRYTFPNGLNEVQIDTLSFAEWDDGTCRTNITSPYAGIAIDPFSDPADFDSVHQMYPSLSQYYILGMNQSGSTAVQIEGVHIANFIVGVVIAPGYQENGEEIDITDCSIDHCRSLICPTNAQQKSNYVTRLQAWGWFHTAIDCGRYGARRGDGTIFPIVDEVNIAGFSHQFLNYYAGSHPGSARNVYAEELYKIGFSGGPAGFNFDNCQFNLQLPDAGVPFPDYVYAGGPTNWTNTEIRTYGDSMRIILNTPGNVFHAGVITNPPVCINQEMPVSPQYPPTRFDDVQMYTSGPYFLNGNGYDSIVSFGRVTITVNPDFTGYFVSPGYLPKIGDLLITQHAYGDDYKQYGGPIGSLEYPLGIVAGISGDTIQLRHIGQGLRTGNILQIYDAKLKQL